MPPPPAIADSNPAAVPDASLALLLLHACGSATAAAAAQLPDPAAANVAAFSTEQQSGDCGAGEGDWPGNSGLPLLPPDALEPRFSFWRCFS
jgi:hypothetical protein